MGFRVARTIRTPTEGWDVKIFGGEYKDAPTVEQWNSIVSKTPVRIAKMSKLSFWFENGGQDDHFALTAAMTHKGEAGVYKFSVFADDGVRVFVDDKLIIDHRTKATEQPIHQTATLKMDSKIKVEYWQRDQAARLDVQFKRE
jgi:hypothetical protein